MAPRIRPLTPSELTPEQQALYGAITGGPRAQGPQHFALTSDDGSLRGPFDVMLRSPAVGTAQQELGAAIRYRTGFTDRMRELAILLVAAHLGQRVRARVARGDRPRARLSRRGARRASARSMCRASTADEGVVGRATVALLDGDLSDEAWDAASTVLGVDGVFELTALVGYYATLALQLRVFRVE